LGLSSKREPGLLSGKVVAVGDSEVLRAALEDPERFEEVFDRHHRVIWRYLARVSGRDRADDLTGEVFAVAFANRARYDADRGSVRSWLYGIASNLLRTRLRSEARQARAFARAASRELDAPSSVDVVDDQLADQEQLGKVLTAFSNLSVSDREIITLFVWEQLSYVELAAVLGVELGTVRSRLARARARLRELAGLSGEVEEEVEK
jgi:RNA polymerase sigma factor (sigma-70 family)